MYSLFYLSLSKFHPKQDFKQNWPKLPLNLKRVCPDLSSKTAVAKVTKLSALLKKKKPKSAETNLFATVPQANSNSDSGTESDRESSISDSEGDLSRISGTIEELSKTEQSKMATFLRILYKSWLMNFKRYKYK